jgi:NAD-dependent deacetylase
MKRVFILSGAGLSQESGISTFRDSDGLWENHDVMEVCSRAGWIKNRNLVTQFYNQRRVELQKAQANKAHILLANLQNKYRGRIIHLTQNIDNLMEQAGVKDIIHLHGTLVDLRCELCTETFNIGYREQTDEISCPYCGNKRVRHNVVMFGESAPEYMQIEQSTRLCTLFIAIGTSGEVIDITKIAKEFNNSVLIDPKRKETKNIYDKHQYIDEYFSYYISKNATDAIDEVVDIIQNYLES